ncbi:hypothetical protein N657DRAFT_313092 [Parathielavia appendiculata]|uniref:Uncharacterized protein n=1 Tax=Parathielavia appendiculata TaxID=2587402 RepID=A0AAN6U665_9PEZI|nr:hypothetical protein N657DRAFT_313092 [Parathielavia appendiculata]
MLDATTPCCPEACVGNTVRRSMLSSTIRRGLPVKRHDQNPLIACRIFNSHRVCRPFVDVSWAEESFLHPPETDQRLWRQYHTPSLPGSTVRAHLFKALRPMPSRPCLPTKMRPQRFPITMSNNPLSVRIAELFTIEGSSCRTPLPPNILAMTVLDAVDTAQAVASHESHLGCVTQESRTNRARRGWHVEYLRPRGIDETGAKIPRLARSHSFAVILLASGARCHRTQRRCRPSDGLTQHLPTYAASAPQARGIPVCQPSLAPSQVRQQASLIVSVKEAGKWRHLGPHEMLLASPSPPDPSLTLHSRQSQAPSLTATPTSWDS